jgi:hypothetical protein
MRIVNLTKNPATPEQIAAGVVDLQGSSLEILKRFMVIEEPQSETYMQSAAGILASLVVAADAEAALVDGASFFASTLETALKERNIKPMHAGFVEA